MAKNASVDSKSSHSTLRRAVGKYGQLFAIALILAFVLGIVKDYAIGLLFGLVAMVYTVETYTDRPDRVQKLFSLPFLGLGAMCLVLGLAFSYYWGLLYGLLAMSYGALRLTDGWESSPQATQGVESRKPPVNWEISKELAPHHGILKPPDELESASEPAPGIDMKTT